MFETPKELALTINRRCEETWSSIIKEGLLVHHPRKDVFNAIVRIVNDVCDGATDETSFKECLKTSYISIMLLGVDKHGVHVCELVHRLLDEELEKPEEELRKNIDATINATMNRLGIGPEVKDALIRELIEGTNNGEPYVSMILNAVMGMAKKKMGPTDFRNLVYGVDLDEKSNRLLIHIVLPKARGYVNASDDFESFDVVIDMRKVGESYLVDTDVKLWLTDLSRPPLLPVNEGKKKKKKASKVGGNYLVTVPVALLPWIDRFLRMGWIPLGSTPEFF